MNVNATGDFPTMDSTVYFSNTYTADNPVPPMFIGGGLQMAQGLGVAGGVQRLGELCAGQPAVLQQPRPATNQSMPKRIVRVYLADTDENVPLEKSLLFKTDEKFTDATDQELYFEIPIQEVLKAHNAYRATLVDKKATQKLGKEVFLEPVKIRDLKMTVVNIASFG